MTVEGSFENLVSVWCDSTPALRVARVFLPEEFAARSAALGWLQHALLEMALTLREPRVAEAKLGWWGEECGLLAERRARHPVLQVLQSQTDASAAAALGRALAATNELQGRQSIADLADLLGAVLAIIEPLERLRVEVCAASDVEAVAVVALLDQMRRWACLAEPALARIPLSILAAAQCDRVAAVSGAGAERALAAICTGLAARLAPKMTAGASALNAIRIDAARRWSARAARFPAKALDGRLNPIGLSTILLAWRLGRAARRR